MPSVTVLLLFPLLTHCRLVMSEERVQERGQRLLELELRLSRVQQENIMLEERNKMLVNHLRHSTTSPSPTDLTSPAFKVWRSKVWGVNVATIYIISR